jgi:hypothetical protein
MFLSNTIHNCIGEGQFFTEAALKTFSKFTGSLDALFTYFQELQVTHRGVHAGRDGATNC